MSGLRDRSTEDLINEILTSLFVDELESRASGDTSTIPFEVVADLYDRAEDPLSKAVYKHALDRLANDLNSCFHDDDDDDEEKVEEETVSDDGDLREDERVTNRVVRVVARLALLVSLRAEDGAWSGRDVVRLRCLPRERNCGCVPCGRRQGVFGHLAARVVCARHCLSN